MTHRVRLALPGGGVLVIAPAPTSERQRCGGPGAPLDADKAIRLAQGWKRGWITIQRMVRRDEGRPVLELIKDKNPARARESE